MCTPFEWWLVGTLGTFASAAVVDVYEVLYDAFYVHNASTDQATDPIPPAWEDDVIYHDMMYMLQVFCRLCIEATGYSSEDSDKSSDFEIAVTMLTFASFVYLASVCVQSKYPPIAFVVLVGVFNYTCFDLGWIFPLTLANVLMIIRCLVKRHHTQCKLQACFRTFSNPAYQRPVTMGRWFAVIKQTTDLIRAIDHNVWLINALEAEIANMHGLFSTVDVIHGDQWAGQHYNGVYWDREYQYLASLIAPAAPAAIPAALSIRAQIEADREIAVVLAEDPDRADAQLRCAIAHPCIDVIH
jgi:hypothetical protein